MTKAFWTQKYDNRKEAKLESFERTAISGQGLGNLALMIRDQIRHVTGLYYVRSLFKADLSKSSGLKIQGSIADEDDEGQDHHDEYR